MSAPLAELPPRLRDRYDLVKRLGAGGFGTVWLAQDRELERPVALKLLNMGKADQEVLARFDREARATARIRHPNLIQVLDYGRTPEGQAFLVLELIEGLDLEAWRASHGAPGEARWLEWASQGGAALDAVHQAGLVHRDVKPSNFLVRPAGDLVLTDLGIARAATGTVRTATGLLLGTPAYLPPEVWQGQAPTAASDQWAWAATLAWLRSGQPPYGTNAPKEILARLDGYRARGVLGYAGHDWPTPTALVRALDADPSRRFPSVTEMANELAVPGEPSPPLEETAVVAPASDHAAITQQARSTEPAPSSTSAPPEGRATGPGRRRAFTAGAAVLLVAVLVAVFRHAPRSHPGPGESPPVRGNHARGREMDDRHQERLGEARRAVAVFRERAERLGVLLEDRDTWMTDRSLSSDQQIDIFSKPDLRQAWVEFLESLGTMLRALEPHLTKEERRDLAPWIYKRTKLLEYLRRIHMDLMGLHFSVTQKLRRVFDPRDLSPVTRLWEAAGGALSRVVYRNRRSNPTPSPAVAALLSTLKLSGPLDEALAEVPLVLDDLPYPETGTPRSLSVRMIWLLVDTLHLREHSRRPSCEIFSKAISVMRDCEASRPNGTHAHMRLRLRILEVRERIWTRANCPEPLSDPRAEALAFARLSELFRESPPPAGSPELRIYRDSIEWIRQAPAGRRPAPELEEMLVRHLTALEGQAAGG